MRHLFISALIILMIGQVGAQSLTTRSSEFHLDLKHAKNVTGDIPNITWAQPIPDISFSQNGRFPIKVMVESSTPIKTVTIDILDSKTNESKGMQKLIPNENEKNQFLLEKNLMLLDGENTVRIIAENQSGIKTNSSRKVNVGAEAIANATRLDRTDYALLFATDNYEYWSDLVNPVFDARTIAEDLKKNFGFQVEIIENAPQGEILSKIREYSERKFKPMDQLFIFFAGHGNYDQAFGEGFVVTTESLLNDEGKTSYLSHNRLRSIVNNIPCEHIFLTMDVCFGGTFDEVLASARGMDQEVYKEQGKVEFISRKLLSKTRKYLTSGGKTYVSDGIKGQHSPFAKNFLEALDSKGGSDGILTVPELFSFVEKLKNPPKMGGFGNDQPGSDFLFVVR